MNITIKICGLTDEQAVRSVISAHADFAGFVYFPTSPRHVTISNAIKLKSILPATILSVSVLVDPDDTLLDEVQAVLQPSYVQLHGKESPQRLSAIKQRFPGIRLIKAIKVRSADDVSSAMQFSNCADMLLFDAKPPEVSGALPGGNGLSFDWALLNNRDFPLPWMLSGGLNSDNIHSAIHATGAKMIDVSSGVESAPGVKDASLIDAFIKAARTA